MTANAPAIAADGNALVIRGLKKKFGARAALDGLDLTVPAGTVYGFLGPNGAGKTTTMRILTGLIHPDAGTVELLGKSYNARDRRLFSVGALVEAPSFYPYLSARDNLKVLAAAGAPVAPNRVDELLGLVGLRDRAKDRVGSFSMGMKQRLGIAGALLNDPQLLLLDEPANGLDPAGIVGMRETLQQMAASGKTVFVSSHILGEVEQLADVVGIISAGRLVREGRLEDLLASEQRVRVRVRPDQVGPASTVLSEKLGSGNVSAAEEAWLTVTGDVRDPAEVNRLLAEAGIYASGLESGSDLEALFLQLTAQDAPVQLDWTHRLPAGVVGGAK